MSAVDNVGCFTEVDRANDPSFFVRFLDEANALPSVRTSKADVLVELRLRGGQAVLDVGCGTGAEVLAMAKVVGPNGRAVGIDLSEVLIAEAKARSASCDLPVEYEIGDAQALRFEDGVFDACRAERVLMHVLDPQRALSEMVRVTRVGGRLAVLDLDFDTLVVDSPDRQTTRVVLRRLSNAVRHGWMGRQLPRVFKEADLVDVRVTPRTVFFGCDFLDLLVGGHVNELQDSGLLSAADVIEWWRALWDSQKAGTFFGVITAFIVAATKP